MMMYSYHCHVNQRLRQLSCCCAGTCRTQLGALIQGHDACQQAQLTCSAAWQPDRNQHGKSRPEDASLNQRSNLPARGVHAHNVATSPPGYGTLLSASDCQLQSSKRCPQDSCRSREAGIRSLPWVPGFAASRSRWGQKAEKYGNWSKGIHWKSAGRLVYPCKQAHAFADLNAGMLL